METANKPKKKEKRMGREILSWAGTLAAALVIALVIRSFVFTLIAVKGKSMQETLQNGDRLYVSILTARISGYERGDVVICRYPGRSDYCVKRVIGLPGDVIAARNGVIYLNGEPLKEDYVSPLHAAHYDYPETALGEDEYFLLGDNRFISHDSHSADVGPVTDIVGKARAIIWPPAHISAL
ncbi:MAG: signal peptidase I [Clostridiales bacterium]|nr:signal peptidase I [Clostridiales bacterium]